MKFCLIQKTLGVVDKGIFSLLGQTKIIFTPRAKDYNE